MIPTIHKPFLLKLLLATAAAGGGLFAAHAVQADHIPAALLAQADRTAATRPDDAVRFLRRYLEFRPDDLDARERLAKLLQARPAGADPAELLFLYGTVLRADPARLATRREALALCVRVSRYSDAEGHARELLKAQPADAETWRRLGVALAGLSRHDEATAAYEEAVRHAPADPAAYQRLAQHLWKDRKRVADARKVLDRFVSAAPQAAEAYLTRARFDLFTAPETDVRSDLRQAVSLAPDDADARLLYAERLGAHGDLSAARAELREAVRRHPADPRPARSLAWLELSAGDHTEAIRVLEAAADRTPDPTDLLVPLGDLLLQTNQPDRAEALVSRLEAAPGGAVSLPAKYLRARVALHAGRWAEAVSQLSDLRTEAAGLPDLEAQANLLLAECHRRRNDPAEEQSCLRLLLNRNPDHLAARVSLAESHRRAGQFADAVAEYAQAARRPGAGAAVRAGLVRAKALHFRAGGREALADADPADLLAAAHYLDGPDHATVLERAAAGLTPPDGRPPTVPAGLLLARVKRAAGDRAAAWDVLNRLLREHPNHPDVVLAALDELLAFGAAADAEPFLAKLREVAPADPRVPLAAARLERQRDRRFGEREPAVRGTDDDPTVSARLREAWAAAADPAAVASVGTTLDRVAAEVGYTREVLDIRARARIAAARWADAERDLRRAVAGGPAARPQFHVALLHLGRTPADPAAADRAFRRAVSLGLTEADVHPADRPRLAEWRNRHATFTDP